MDRGHVLEVVERHFHENVLTETGPFDPQRSMLDMGAGSLDAVEIVSASMRELAVTIPRTSLASAKNVNQLVDMLVKAISEVR